MDREALRQLAAKEYRSGKLAEAVQYFRQATHDDDKGAEDYCNCGMILTRLGKTNEAIEALKKALSLRPKFFEAWYNLGIALAGAARLEESIAAYEEAIKIQPGNDVARNNLGNTYCKLGRYDASMDELRRAAELRPDNGDYLYNLGIALQLAGKIADARDSFRRAIELDPNLIEAYTNLGALHLSRGELEESTDVYQRALGRNPAAAMVHWNLSQVLLLQGKYKEGWPEYDWRRRVPEFEPFTAEFSQPMWDGGDLRGARFYCTGSRVSGTRSILRGYAPLVAQRGGKAMMACQPKVLRLMRSLPGVDNFFSSADQLPGFDLHCALPSLPLVFGLPGPEDYQWAGPYFKTEAADRERFADEIARDEGKLKVGLVWSGGAASRSIDPASDARTTGSSRCAVL